MKKEPLEFLGNFINGGFRKSEDPQGQWKKVSPADLEDVVGAGTYDYASVDQAVLCARRAFSSWKQTRFEERKALLLGYAKKLEQRQEQFAEVISREVGKPLWEAKTEVKAMITKVKITIEESMKMVLPIAIENVLPNTQGKCTYMPLGVMAVIGPFNFPGHLPNGHIVPALLMGNTVILKPSEKTPFVGQWIAECFQAAGVPKGVFQCVQGEKEVGRRLCVHEGIDGVLFTGSYEVGLRVKQETMMHYWKLLALEMGGKNTSIIWKDAPLSETVWDHLVGSYVTTGQRCSCTSRILVHEEILDSFLELFHQRAKKIQIGHPQDHPFMGPLIDHHSVDRNIKFLGIAQREGAEILMRGKKLDRDPQGHYLSPSICFFPKELSLEEMKKSYYLQTEIFGPQVAILKYRDLDQAIELANASSYGLVASVYAQDSSVYQKCFHELRFGNLNWNRPTTGASSRLPFGGVKKSGNFFPTALFAPRYCSYPMSALKCKIPQGRSDLYPGLGG